MVFQFKLNTIHSYYVCMYNFLYELIKFIYLYKYNLIKKHHLNMKKFITKISNTYSETKPAGTFVYNITGIFIRKTSTRNIFACTMDSNMSLFCTFAHYIIIF